YIAGLDEVALTDLSYLQFAEGVQPPRKRSSKPTRHVLHDDHSHRQVARQLRQDFLQCLRAPSKGTHRDDFRNRMCLPELCDVKICAPSDQALVFQLARQRAARGGLNFFDEIMFELLRVKKMAGFALWKTVKSTRT